MTELYILPEFEYCFRVWREAREADLEGTGTLKVCANRRGLISKGERVFWEESSIRPGLLYLYSHKRVTETLNGGGEA